MKTGEERGTTEAREAASKGSSWRLFTTLAFGAFACGAVVGFVAQYGILLTCHFEERLPSPVLLAFVPGMKGSLSYSIFERRFRLMLDFDEQLKKILATKNLQVAQTQAIHDAVKQRIMSARSIEELSEARFLELANGEFSRIVAESEKISRTENGQRSDKLCRRHVCTCPHCAKRIAFKEQAANTTVKCPHPGCGHSVRLPPLTPN